MPSHMRDVDPIFGAVPLDIPNVSWRSSNARAATDALISAVASARWLFRPLPAQETSSRFKVEQLLCMSQPPNGGERLNPLAFPLRRRCVCLEGRGCVCCRGPSLLFGGVSADREYLLATA